MWGIKLLGIALVVTIIFSSIFWNGTVDIETRILGIFLLVILSSFFWGIPYKVYIKRKVKKGEFTDQEGFNKVSKVFRWGIADWAYFLTLDDWYYKKNKKSIDNITKHGL